MVKKVPGSNNNQDGEQPKPLTDEERRVLIEKRIRELRKRKQREKRKAKNGFLRFLPVAILIVFFLLCLTSSLITLGGSGGNDSYLTRDVPATNALQMEKMLLEPGEVVEPDLVAVAAFLMDPDTGDILYEKNADQPLPMASTTKIMTAIVAMENASLNEQVTISNSASGVGESSVWLEEGEVLSVEQLLYALLVQSANDAAAALAEFVGGSEAGFLEMMNQKAVDLGAENTHFANPHGLDQEGHYSSARDLAIIAEYAMREPLFREIVKSDGYQIPWPGHPWNRVLENHNRLLEMYPYATGIKTGYTFGAGRCLVASALKEGRELISVILNSDDYWNETIQLMEYGFGSFSRVEYAYSGQPLAVVEVGRFPTKKVNAVATSDLAFTVRRDHLDQFITAMMYYREWLPYPVTDGQEVGYLVAGEGSKYEREAVLVSDAYRLSPGILVRILSFIAAVFGLWWSWIKFIIPGM